MTTSLVNFGDSSSKNPLEKGNPQETEVYMTSISRDQELGMGRDVHPFDAPLGSDPSRTLLWILISSNLSNPMVCILQSHIDMSLEP